MAAALGGRQKFPYGSRNSLALGLSVLATTVCLAAAALFFLSVKPADNGSAPPVVRDSTETIDVLVAVDRIEAGYPLEPSMFRKEARPVISVPPSAVTDFAQIKGFFASSYIAAGQPLLGEFITSKRPVNQIQPNIPEGYRAVALSVDATTSVEGWARPGAKVDVVLASNINQKPAVTVIVQNAKVLSADRSVAGDGGEGGAPTPSTVT